MSVMGESGPERQLLPEEVVATETAAYLADLPDELQAILGDYTGEVKEVGDAAAAEYAPDIARAQHTIERAGKELAAAKAGAEDDRRSAVEQLALKRLLAAQNDRSPEALTELIIQLETAMYFRGLSANAKKTLGRYEGHVKKVGDDAMSRHLGPGENPTAALARTTALEALASHLEASRRNSVMIARILAANGVAYTSPPEGTPLV